MRIHVIFLTDVVQEVSEIPTTKWTLSFEVAVSLRTYKTRSVDLTMPYVLLYCSLVRHFL
jgi:hypothetical protein